MADTKGPEYKLFDDLIGRHQGLIRKLCWRHSSGSEAVCNELVQDCYVSIWYHLSSLRPAVHALQQAAWVVWQCRSVFSHRYRRRSPDWLPLSDQMADSLPSCDDGVSRELIEDLAVGLSDRERQTFRFILEGFHPREIAEKMGTTSDNINKIRQRIILKMQQEYLKTSITPQTI